MQLAPSLAPQRLALAIAGPLALLALAYAALSISNALVRIGPLDRAMFGWLVVVPLWLAVPGVAGLIWAPLSSRERYIAALAVASVIAVATAILLATSITQVGCQPVTSWTDDLPLSIVVGMAFGASHAGAGLAAAAIAHGMTGMWRIVVSILTGGVSFAIGAVITFFVFATLYPIGLTCRPI